MIEITGKKDYECLDRVSFRKEIYDIKTLENRNKNKCPKLKAKWDEKNKIKTKRKERMKEY